MFAARDGIVSGKAYVALDGDRADAGIGEYLVEMQLIARAHDIGHFGFEAKATSIDPMQAEICGIALALGPNDACYVRVEAV